MFEIRALLKAAIVIQREREREREREGVRERERDRQTDRQTERERERERERENFMASFYAWGSLQRGSLLVTTNLPEIPGTHLIDLGRIKD